MRKLTLIAAAVAIALALLLWVLTIPATVPASALPPHNPDLANGQTMFNIGGCASCHSTPSKDPANTDRTRLGGGLSLSSPFGTFYVPNISPDAADGIGVWSEADFVTALWKGTSPRGRHLFPAFPYTSYQHMELTDLRDLFAYLKTLPPVAGRVRQHDLAFPFNIRRLIGLWKLLFLHGGPFVPTQQNRPNGIVAPTSSTVRAIAPNATARAIFSARSSKVNASPAGQRRTAGAGSPISRRPDCNTTILPGRKKTSRASLPTA